MFKKELPGGEPLPWALAWCAFPSFWMLLSLLFRLVSNPAPASAGQLWLLALLHWPPGLSLSLAPLAVRHTERTQRGRPRGLTVVVTARMPGVVGWDPLCRSHCQQCHKTVTHRERAQGGGVSVWGSPTAWTKAQEMENLMKPQSEIDDSISEIK